MLDENGRAIQSADQTGKAAGKRILTDDGTWVAVSSLSSEIQAEIKANTHKADQDRMKKALSNNKEYMDLQAEKTEQGLRAENNDLKEMVKEQGAMLAKINAKMELGASVQVAPVKIAKEVTAKKPTKKQSIQIECEAKGLEFEEDDTIKDLQAKLDQYEVDAFDTNQEA